MAKRLVKTLTGYAVYGGEFGGPEKVSTKKVKELGLDLGFGFFGTRKLSNLEYKALTRQFFNW